MNKLSVSLSPHVHTATTVQSCMRDVLIALAPALIVSFCFFGLGAVLVTLTSVASCVIFEFAIQKYILKVTPSVSDLSAIVTGVLLAFNLPSNIPLWIVIIGALVAIGIGKMAFGGIGCNIFNPALVGRVFLLIAYPVQMTTWPVSGSMGYADVETAATPLALFTQWFAAETPQAADAIMAQMPSALDMLLGTTGGAMGEVSALALLLGFVYLLVRKVITWHAPVAIFAAAYIMALICGYGAYGSLQMLLTGGMMLGAIYMATDYTTSPMNNKGLLVYGCFIGILTILIRRFGAYPEGMSFAILIMNGFTPIINTYVKPTRFGVVKAAKK